MVSEEPLKWQKHLKLVDFGLREYEELIAEIHRYGINELFKLYSDIKQELLADFTQQIHAFYIIKLVNKKQFYKLPNYRVYCLNDLDNFLYIFQSKKSYYDELWYCRTQDLDYNNQIVSVAGRISFEKEFGGNSQRVEQIWNKSPRMIEEFNLSAEFIYLRSSRISWGYRFSIDELYIPDILKNEESMIIQQFSNSMVKIEQVRERLELFEEYLSSFNYKVFSLEYKVLNDNLSIIDWDTPNDMLVLNA